MTTASVETPLATREEFVQSVRRCICDRHPFAAGKTGTSESTWLCAPAVAARESDPRRRAAFHAAVRFHATQQSGVFPADPAFLARFIDFHASHLRSLDFLGVFGNRPALENTVLHHYGIAARRMPFDAQEPCRTLPDAPDRCYLPALEGRRLLLLCPFARLLRERATRETFEAVWARTGKRWFAPADVQAIEFPYGVEPSTWSRYRTVIDLYQEICREVDRCEFDVALIAAGGLGIPLASYIRSRGKVALSLGGHLQMIFGVLGRRWRDERRDFDVYLTPAWTDMPASYRPNATYLADGGAYW